jgi:hypothetical protein
MLEFGDSSIHLDDDWAKGMAIRVRSDPSDDGKRVDKRTLVSFHTPGDNDAILPNGLQLQAIDKKSIRVLKLGRSGGRVHNEDLMADERQEHSTLCGGLRVGSRYKPRGSSQRKCKPGEEEQTHIQHGIPCIVGPTYFA